MTLSRILAIIAIVGLAAACGKPGKPEEKIAGYKLKVIAGSEHSTIGYFTSEAACNNSIRNRADVRYAPTLFSYRASDEEEHVVGVSLICVADVFYKSWVEPDQ